MIVGNQEDEANITGKDEKAEKPAELFRKDLISAMKLPDNTQLADDSYYFITDSWRMDWEKSVQVPVLDQDQFKAIKYSKKLTQTEKVKFSLPTKYLHSNRDTSYNKLDHQLYDCSTIHPECSRYDLDETDFSWLQKFNTQRMIQGQPELQENHMEVIIEKIEDICSETMQTKIKTVVGLGIEYDENIVCDVCRSPDSEDTNEMVFCDKCDVCVHQACYGIQKIPTGSWLCRVCVLGIKTPKCVLCPNTGGAMKTTPSGNNWSHVSCALWIPEVSFACADKMEPIVNIALIPANRWALNCIICREKNTGACIQCAVRTCNIAFHVTCAIRFKLLMQTMVDLTTDDVRFKAFCSKHTKIMQANPTKPVLGQSIIDNSRDRTKICNEVLTVEQIDERRAKKLNELAKEFYLCVNHVQLQTALSNFESDIIDPVFNYWKLKRRANFDKALLPPLVDTLDEDRQEELNMVARVKMFIHLRQDLERVRNLCYMVSRREKLSRQYLLTIIDEFKMRRKLWNIKSKPLHRSIKKHVDSNEDDDDSDDQDLPLSVIDKVKNEVPQVKILYIDPELQTKKQRKRRRIEDDIDSILLDTSKTSTLYDLHESILEQVKREDVKKEEEEIEKSKSEEPLAPPRCIKQCVKRIQSIVMDTDDTDQASGTQPTKALTVRKYKQQKNKTEINVSTNESSLPCAAKKIIMDAYERSNVRAAHSKTIKEPKKKDPIVSSIRQNVQNSISDFFRRTINQK